MLNQRVGRDAGALRRVTIETGVAPYAEGSALISFGSTRIWCTATVEESVPPWLEGRGSGWVTAEYSMLPRSTQRRITRSRATDSGRSQEISRLIGRSLRASINLKSLGARTITIDCDVLQADGGTRTAAITGGFVALALACRTLTRTKLLRASPIATRVASVSVGLVTGEPRLDLDYTEDAAADVDMNVVMNSRGELIEVQGTAERRPFSRADFNLMLDLAQAGIEELLAMQAEAIGDGNSPS